jgi:hypothetical protein
MSFSISFLWGPSFTQNAWRGKESCLNASQCKRLAQRAAGIEIEADRSGSAIRQDGSHTGLEFERQAVSGRSAAVACLAGLCPNDCERGVTSHTPSFVADDPRTVFPGSSCVVLMAVMRGKDFPLVRDPQTNPARRLVKITLHERSAGKSVCNSTRKIVIHVRCFRDAARFQTSPLDIRHPSAGFRQPCAEPG